MADADPLQVDGVSVDFGGLRALDEVSLRVPPGAIVGLIGPNGAGKTTLFECVTGGLRLGLSRRVELARARCTDPKLLLLDEPSSGLRGQESARVAALLDEVRTEHGVSVLVVEHDMPFVLGLCDYVYVLDFGRLL